jgi:hypothetical protein
MQEAASTVVQVVTSGTDWPAIAAGIATGVVGLAGIGGTLWQGKRAREAASKDLRESLDAATTNLQLGIEAENKRAHDAEKRRIYAECLTALNEVILAALVYGGSAAGDVSKDVDARLNKALDATFKAGNEARLIASAEVQGVLSTSIREVSDLAAGTLERESSHEVNAELSSLWENLWNTMRADLGEPVEPAEPGSS